MNLNKIMILFIPLFFLFCKKDEKDKTPLYALGALVISNQTAKLPIYINFVSHNEESTAAGDPDYAQPAVFTSSRNLVKQMADTITSKGGKWNYESDWKFLTSIKNYEPNGASDTNNKNLIRWMKEDKKIEIDPHAHETAYNYADVAKLISDLGVEPSKVIGGFVYDDTGATTWERMQSTLKGVQFPTYSWTAEILWGAASKNHTSDDRSFGAWKPTSPSAFSTHDASKTLIYMGSGCENVVKSTSTASDVVGVVVNVINKVNSGAYPKTGFYPITIMLNQRDFSTNYIQTISSVLDSLKPYVDNGSLQWAYTSEKKTIWIQNYNSQANRMSCN